jgi:hypothetical protein
MRLERAQNRYAPTADVVQRAQAAAEALPRAEALLVENYESTRRGGTRGRRRGRAAGLSRGAAPAAAEPKAAGAPLAAAANSAA